MKLNWIKVGKIVTKRTKNEYQRFNCLGTDTCVWCISFAYTEIMSKFLIKIYSLLIEYIVRKMQTFINDRYQGIDRIYINLRTVSSRVVKGGNGCWIKQSCRMTFLVFISLIMTRIPITITLPLKSQLLIM